MRGEILREVGRIGDSLAAFENALPLLEDDSKRCRARIGIAAALRIQDRFAEALDVLSAAERAAARSADAEALAEIDVLRGGVLFSLGRAEECLDAHTQALRYAREAGSPMHEARAQSGLGDAYYQRGQMSTAYRYYGQCITLCREHGYGRIEVANLAMRGWTRFYQNELADTCEDLAHAAEIAERVADQRAEALARFLLATAQSYVADWMSGRIQAERGLALARRLGAKRLEAAILRAQADLLIGAGQAAEAETKLDGAYALSVQTGTETFVGPWILAVLARATTDAAKRRWALSEGETVLARSNVAHSHLHYYQNAIEVALIDKDWEAAERYACALERYTETEPLPWSTFVIMCGRALARLGSGQADAVTLATLKGLRSQAERGGLHWALPRLRLALDHG